MYSIIQFHVQNWFLDTKKLRICCVQCDIFSGISTNNYMFGRAIWDKLPDWFFKCFKISRALFFPKFARTIHVITGKSASRKLQNRGQLQNSTFNGTMSIMSMSCSSKCVELFISQLLHRQICSTDAQFLDYHFINFQAVRHFENKVFRYKRSAKTF